MFGTGNRNVRTRPYHVRLKFANDFSVSKFTLGKTIYWCNSVDDMGYGARYGHDGPGVCLGDGQTEAEGVPSQGGRGDTLLPRVAVAVPFGAMPPYLT